MKTPTMNRRAFAHLGLSLTAAAALTACGGGSSSSDSDTSSKVNLRKAFDEIEYKMTKDEVRAVVGRHEDNESSFAWYEGAQTLYVYTARNDQLGSYALAVQWESGSQVLVRELHLGE